MPYFAKIRSGKGSIDLGDYMGEGNLKLVEGLPRQVNEKVARALELSYPEPIHIFFSTVEVVDVDPGADKPENAMKDASEEAQRVIDQGKELLERATVRSKEILDDANRHAARIKEGHSEKREDEKREESRPVGRPKNEK